MSIAVAITGKRFRWFSRRGRGRFGTAFLGIAIALAVVGRPWLRDGGTADLTLEAFGWIVYLAGAMLRLWAILYIGGRKSKVVLTEGPYALVRHPLYLGSFLIALAGALFLDSILLLIGLLLTAIAYRFYVIPREEQFMVGRFGDDYADYCKRTARFIPHRSSWARGTTRRLDVDLDAIRTEMSRAIWWMLLPLFTAVATVLRDQPWWPHLVPWP